ncbi:hypothetical protein [Halorarum salinum]|uniref:HpcH/HpaI aldolase/citrate lyase domain-containing protein n=1 Tax=Halorarum salinum TaxID=2743089 RepID=A0A7D5LB02_9EURY|nr:hypothetical protein [Halobaculum salinum]QLG61775.1 hypothetical protein HUG12_08555 [Halobaculum salinum]
MSRVAEAGGEAGTAVGSLAVSAADVDRWMGLGFDFLIVGTDRGYLIRGGTELTGAFEDAVSGE